MAVAQIGAPAIVALLALLLAGCGGSDGAGAYQWGWYVFNPALPKGASNIGFMLAGFLLTVTISAAAIAISVVLGTLLAIAGLSQHAWLRGINRAYVEVFRAIPLLVLLLWVYYGLPVVVGLQLNAFWAGVLSLALSDSAFEAEVFRAGIQAVPRGQREAAQALGLSERPIMRLVVLPQALRMIVPPLTSQYLAITKNSSLAVAIGFPDLVSVAGTTLNQTGQAIEGVAIIMLVFLTISLSITLFMNWYNARIALVEG